MTWNKKNPQTQQDFDFKTRDYCGKEGNSFRFQKILFYSWKTQRTAKSLIGSSCSAQPSEVEVGT